MILALGILLNQDEGAIVWWLKPSMTQILQGKQPWSHEGPETGLKETERNMHR